MLDNTKGTGPRGIDFRSFCDVTIFNICLNSMWNTIVHVFNLCKSSMISITIKLYLAHLDCNGWLTPPNILYRSNRDNIDDHL